MAEDAPGRLLDGKYELLEPLGRGGMALVWRAVTLGPDGFRRAVAVKRIDPQFKGYPEVTSMFVEEARVGAMLRHPHVVQVHDFRVDEDGDHYLVTELVEGPHLGNWVFRYVRDGKETPWPIVTAIGIEVLRALSAAHEHVDESGNPSPILHRDVTPPNILIDVSGVVKLADFGLARAMDRARTTRPDVVKGKLSYLAPELVLGAAPTVQSDLFSLGIVLWEALTGKRLFDADTDINVIHQLREARVPLLAMVRPNLPMRLCTIVHRALERDPARRFRSALEMLTGLTEVLRVVPGATDAGAISATIEISEP